MFATPIRLAQGGFPSFWRRSMDELKRQTQYAIKMQGLHEPKKAFPLIHFDDAGSIDRCKVMSDVDMGGFSKATLNFVDGAKHNESKVHEGIIGDVNGLEEEKPGGEPAHVLFQGGISTELPPNKPEVQRSGYAAWRTRDRGYWLFGKLLWDVDPYAFLALRIKSDGRKYFVNVQTESIVPTDLHQHLLPTYTPGHWETVIIPFHAFVRTNHGMVVEPQKEMMRQKVRSVGIGLTDRVQGPFELRVADVYATNRAPRTEQRAGSGFDLETGHEEIEEGGQGRAKEPEKILI